MLRAAPFTLLSLRKRTATLALAAHRYPFQNAAVRCSSSSSNDEDFLDYFNHTSNRPSINRSRNSQSNDFVDNRPRRDPKNNQRWNRPSHQNHHGPFPKQQNQNQVASSPQPRGTPHQKQQNSDQRQGQKFQQQKPQPATPQPERLAQLIQQLRTTTGKSKGATTTPIIHDPHGQAPQERPKLLQPTESITSSFSMNSDLRILPRRDDETFAPSNLFSRPSRPFPWSEQREPGQQQRYQQQQRHQQYQRQPQKEQQQNQQQSQQHLHQKGHQQQQQQQQQQDLQNRMRQHINPFKGLPRRNFQDGLEFLEGRSSRETDSAKKNQAAPEQATRTVTLPSGAQDISLTETASLFRIKADDLLEKLQSLGTDTTPGKEVRLDIDTLELLAMEFGIETVRVESEVVKDNEELLMNQRRTDTVSASLPPRPPVVCIMGHVDHGKTTLMDALRRRSMEQPKQKSKKTKEKQGKGAGLTTDIAGTEAGGITQIISAFQVEVEGQDNKVTFLDTPGHAAFKSMRQSGSHAADVIVLVIAADDGVSEQTIEILDFYKSIVKGSNGGITMMVALNKIDKPGIDVDEARRRVENQLLEHEILCEGIPGTSEYGPPVQVIPTSGLTGQGLNELIEGLVLQSEVMDLRADHEACAEGIVMDARIEKGLGVIADCIIRWGSIEKGDIIVSGTQASRVRLLKDVNGQVLNRGIPSQPVRIVGFKSLPKAGDPILCVESQEVADEMVEQRAAVNEEVVDRTINADEVEIHINGMRRRDTRRVAKFHELAGLEESDGTIRIPIVVKADADGSLSAIRDSLVSLGAKSSHKVIVDPIQEGIGDITASDIQMAKESEACIFAFGLKRIDPAMLNLAESEGVVIMSNDIIYSLLDEAKETLGKYLPPQPVEHIHGRGTIQAIFVVDGDLGEEKVAGLRVMDGFFYKEKSTNDLRCHFRVYRNGTLISPESTTVTAASLRKFKEQVQSVRRGEECGLALSGFEDFQEGDEIECYSVEMKSPTL